MSLSKRTAQPSADLDQKKRPRQLEPQWICPWKQKVTPLLKSDNSPAGNPRPSPFPSHWPQTGLSLLTPMSAHDTASTDQGAGLLYLHLDIDSVCERFIKLLTERTGRMLHQKLCYLHPHEATCNPWAPYLWKAVITSCSLSFIWRCSFHFQYSCTLFPGLCMACTKKHPEWFYNCFSVLIMLVCFSLFFYIILFFSCVFFF